MTQVALVPLVAVVAVVAQEALLRSVERQYA
jgi:hypothetical protein